MAAKKKGFLVVDQEALKTIQDHTRDAGSPLKSQLQKLASHRPDKDAPLGHLLAGQVYVLSPGHNTDNKKGRSGDISLLYIHAPGKKMPTTVIAAMPKTEATQLAATGSRSELRKIAEVARTLMDKYPDRASPEATKTAKKSGPSAMPGSTVMRFNY
jgi:hypothetical protein